MMAMIYKKIISAPIGKGSSISDSVDSTSKPDSPARKVGHACSNPSEWLAPLLTLIAVITPISDVLIALYGMAYFIKIVTRGIFRFLGSKLGITGYSLSWLRSKYEENQRQLSRYEDAYFKANIVYRIRYPSLDITGYHESKKLIRQLAEIKVEKNSSGAESDKILQVLNQLHPASVKLFKHIAHLEVREVNSTLIIDVQWFDACDFPITKVRPLLADEGRKIAVGLIRKKTLIHQFAKGFITEYEIIKSGLFWIFRISLPETTLRIEITNGLVNLNCPKVLSKGKEFKAALTLLGLKAAYYYYRFPGVDKTADILNKLSEDNF